MGHQGFDEEYKGQDQKYGEDKYQGYGFVLRSGGDKIRPSGGTIKSGYQRIGNEEGPVQSRRCDNVPPYPMLRETPSRYGGSRNQHPW